MSYFYFDFTSPYSYLTWERLLQLNFPLESLTILPVVVGKIINDVGSIGPAGIKAKRNFLFQDCLRKSVKFDISIKSPSKLPFNPMDMLRFAISLGLENKEEMHKFITEAFRYGWRDGFDYEDFEKFRNYIIAHMSLSQERFEFHLNNKETRKILKENNSHATANGIFGVPSFVTNNKVFWGFEALPDFMNELEHKDLFDRKRDEYQNFINIVDN